MGLWSRIFPAQVKASVPSPISAMQMGSPFAALLSPAEITPYQAWLAYENISTVAKIVDLIADEVASLMPLVKINGEIDDESPIHKFLKKPGFNRTRRRLIKELAVQYLVTGTAYVHVIGNVQRPPLAFDVLKTKFIAPFPGADMWPDIYSYSEGTRTIRFHREGDPRDPRWLDDQGVGEIIPIYDMDGQKRGIGLPRLNAIKHDMELRLKGIMHNASLLDNGARPSGIMSFKDQLNEEQREDLKAQLRSMVSGIQNVGKILVTAGGEHEFSQLSQSAKDMDFANLVRIVEDAIASRYNVPVTLFRIEAQTNNNYETAWYTFYNTAVIPAFQIVYAGLSQIFSERLLDQQGQPMEVDIEHDALTNAVLAKQASQRATQLFGQHIISRNEAREIVGFEPALGGDTIYGPMGEVPVGEDLFTGRDEHLNADGYHDMRRERAPDQVPPGEGEQHEQEQQRADAEAAAAAKKPATEKRLALVT